MPRDKLLHIAMGLGAVVVTLLAYLLSMWRPGAAVALITTAFGIFYEFQQWYRKEGQPDPWDAAATAAPGWAAWVVLELIA